MSVDKYTKEVTLKPGVKNEMLWNPDRNAMPGWKIFLKPRQITHLFRYDLKK